MLPLNEVPENLTVENWFSFTPLIDVFNMDIPCSSAILFSKRISFKSIPDWVRTEECLQLADERMRDRLRQGQFGFCSEYQAEALGSPDPEFPGRGVQDVIFEELVLALLSVWIVKPAACSTGLFAHICGNEKYAVLRQLRDLPPNLVPELGEEVLLSSDDLAEAKIMFTQILKLNRNGAIWTAINLLSKGSSERLWNIRFLVYAILLEALFGPDDGREITYRLSTRIASFLAHCSDERKKLFSTTKTLYGWRSKIVHGNRLSKLSPTQSEDLMMQMENLVRQCLRGVLLSPNLKLFEGKKREEFLDELIFSST